MLQPIETRYQGYNFRSRLEARWAVFFDRLNLHWEYEKEGFYIDNVMYLPDFFVRSEHGEGWFIEVKGDMSDSDSIRKQQMLDRNPPPYALGCLLVGLLDYPSLSDNPRDWNHMNQIANILLADKSLTRIMEAVLQARGERFLHNNWRLDNGK